MSRTLTSITVLYMYCKSPAVTAALYMRSSRIVRGESNFLGWLENYLDRVVIPVLQYVNAVSLPPGKLPGD